VAPALVQPTLFFSTQSYAYLRDELCRLGDGEIGAVDTRTFPDGERYLRVASSVDGRDVVLVGGTISDSDTLELYDLACAFAKYGARRFSLVIPYFGYSTMERAVKRGEVVTAKNRARLLSSIPATPAQSRILLFDLHAEGLPHYFEGVTRPVHVYGKAFVTDVARRIAGKDEFVMACTDAGRAKWVESLANDMQVPASFVFKRRIDERRTEVTAVSAQVDGKCVVIYDDMIRTGGSLLNAAQAYRAAGATRIAAIATHGLFPADALARLRAAGIFESIDCTDSHPRARALADDFLRVTSCAPALAKALGTAE
jgi:ribose-phosphate pyrophosphokinase